MRRCTRCGAVAHGVLGAHQPQRLQREVRLECAVAHRGIRGVLAQLRAGARPREVQEEARVAMRILRLITAAAFGGSVVGGSGTSTFGCTATVESSERARRVSNDPVHVRAHALLKGIGLRAKWQPVPHTVRMISSAPSGRCTV